MTYPQHDQPREPRFGWPAATPAAILPADLPPRPAETPIKVLHVIHRFKWGFGNVALLCALGMDPRRYEMWIVGGNEDGDELWSRAREGGVNTVAWPQFRAGYHLVDLLVLIRLIRLIRRERFTIVHTHGAKGNVLGRIAAWICRTPVVVHTFPGFQRITAYSKVESKPHQLGDGYIAVSPTVARQAIEDRKAPPAGVRVIPAAVEMDIIPTEFSKAGRADLGVPSDVTLIGTVGRIEPQKGHLDFVRMAAQVRKTHPNTAFVIVGDGQLAEDVRRLAAELDVDVRITGYLPEAERLIAGMDVFVMTSLYEGVPLVLVAALVSGRPCVSTAVDGIPDLIDHGTTGLLTPRSDPAAAATAVRWMIDHPEEAAAMGKQGQVRTGASFAPDRMCAAVDAYYSELLSQPDPTS
jgi:glycosyltransferase involved in cell wall biosynthesis